MKLGQKQVPMRSINVVITLFFLVVSIPTYARDSEFYNDAILRTRYEGFYLQNGRPKNSDNKEDNESTFTTRSQLALNMRKGESIKARVMFQHNFTWGSDVEDPDSSTANPGTGDTRPQQPDGTKDAQNLLLVNEAWLWWKLNEATSLRFGRGQLKLGDGKVMSNNDYLNVPYALDGAILGWSSTNTHTDIFAMKIAEYSETGSIKKDAEYNMFGVSLSFTHLPEYMKLVNVHIIQVQKDLLETIPAGSTPDDSASLYANSINNGRYGIAVAGGTDLDWQLSYAAHAGTIGRTTGDLSWDGQMLDGEVGYKFRKILNSRVAVQIHRDTGDGGNYNATGKYGRYDGFLYDVHEGGGAMDMIAYGNLTYIKASLHFDAMEDLRVKIDAFRFGRTETTDSVVAGTNGTKLFENQRGSASNESAVASEIDIAAEHSYENGLNMQARFSVLSPEAYLSENSGPGSTITQFFMQSRIQF